MSKFMPRTQELNQELTLARKRGDQLEVARVSQELHNYMKEHGINPLKSMLLPMVQVYRLSKIFFSPISLNFFAFTSSLILAKLEMDWPIQALGLALLRFRYFVALSLLSGIMRQYQRVAMETLVPPKLKN